MADPERVLDPIHAGPAPAVEAAGYCLGSGRRDLLAAAMLAILVLAGSPFVCVYYRVTLLDVSVVRIEPDGQRTALPTLPPFGRNTGRPWAVPSGSVAALRALKGWIHWLMRVDPMATVPPGTRFEWTIRYSENSSSLDRTVYLHSVPADVAP
jgi:hypothetical protein